MLVLYVNETKGVKLYRGVCKSAHTGNLFTEREFIAIIVLTMGYPKLHHGRV